MDVVPPPKPPEVPLDPPEAEKEESVELKPNKLPVSKPAKQPGHGVGIAILATVVIILGLAVLVVYAYLRTNHIQVL
jgi:hypothetical protein